MLVSALPKLKQNAAHFSSQHNRYKEGIYKWKRLPLYTALGAYKHAHFVQFSY